MLILRRELDQWTGAEYRPSGSYSRTRPEGKLTPEGGPPTLARWGLATGMNGQDEFGHRRPARRHSRDPETAQEAAEGRSALRLPRALRALPTSSAVIEERPRPSLDPEPIAVACGTSSFSPAVPPTCHKQRSPAVSSGQSRSLGEGGLAGHTPLTWGGGGGRNCMTCKRSRLVIVVSSIAESTGTPLSAASSGQPLPGPRPIACPDQPHRAGER